MQRGQNQTLPSNAITASTTRDMILKANINNKAAYYNDCEVGASNYKEMISSSSTSWDSLLGDNYMSCFNQRYLTEEVGDEAAELGPL